MRLEGRMVGMPGTKLFVVDQRDLRSRFGAAFTNATARSLFGFSSAKSTRRLVIS